MVPANMFAADSWVMQRCWTSRRRLTSLRGDQHMTVHVKHYSQNHPSLPSPVRVSHGRRAEPKWLQQRDAISRANPRQLMENNAVGSCRSHRFLHHYSRVDSLATATTACRQRRRSSDILEHLIVNNVFVLLFHRRSLKYERRSA